MLDPLCIIGDSGDPRVQLFQQALRDNRQSTATVIEYADLLAARVNWDRAVSRGAIVRIESPGRCPRIYRDLVLRGREAICARGRLPITVAELDEGTADRGRIIAPTQWYLGFADALAEIGTALGKRPDVTMTGCPADIALLFDKPACQARLSEGGIPVPPTLGAIGSYDQLRSRMRDAGWTRAYLKLSHGSAASGVVAYEHDSRDREQAWTTVEITEERGGCRLHNSRHIRRYRDRREIAVLVDALCSHGVHTEQWIPKAGLEGRRFDLRVVVIAGDPAHVVVRAGQSPMTNLHLGNLRMEAHDLRRRMGPPAWRELMATCAAVGRLFPRSLHVSVDVAVTPGFRRHVVLEVNAFGDLLRGVRTDGRSTYDAQIQALLSGWGLPERGPRMVAARARSASC